MSKPAELADMQQPNKTQVTQPEESPISTVQPTKPQPAPNQAVSPHTSPVSRDLSQQTKTKEINEMKEKENKHETAQPVSQKTKTTSSSKKKKGKAQPALDTVSQKTKTTQSSKKNEDEKAQPLDHTTVSQLEKKDNEIKLLNKKVKELEQELEQRKKKSNLPHEVDEKHRGTFNFEDSAKEEQRVCKFYRNTYSDVLDCNFKDVDEAEFGTSMVSFSELCYESAKNVLIRKITEQLVFDKLFRYHENPTDEDYAALSDIQNAYGLLVYQQKTKDTDLKTIIKLVEDEVKQSLDNEENKKYKILIDGMQTGPHDKLLKEFYEGSIEQAVRMVSISPPMVLHTQDTFDEIMARPVKSERNLTPPLLWTQPVLMANWTGRVCEKGRADSREEFQKESSV